DRTLEHFADLFHHRALALFYRAWAAGQSTGALDRPDEERFSFYIASLMGTDQAEARQSCLPTHARYGASAHIVRESRNPEGL
ncbi:type VI secretion system baseplate subunit TssG, partial [Paraburkholderia sp. SIMBA_050]